jgi:hypothetical protein
VKELKMRSYFIAAVCLACWLIIAGFPVAGYNSLNESAEAALPLNIPALESLQVNLSQGNGLNYGDYIDEMPHNLTNNETSMRGSVDYSQPNCQSQLRIVDYWGNSYSCNAKCVFLHDVARTIVAPYNGGFLKLYERNPDGNVVGSRYIPVSANKRYNWWFIGDIEGLHTLWFTIQDRYGQISRSNDVTFQVILENCPDISNCSPSSWHA